MRIKVFFSFILLIFFYGCHPHSMNPITSSPEKLLNNQLNGIWEAQDKSGYIQVSKLKNKTIKITMLGDNKYGKIDYMIATVYNSQIGDSNYLSIKVHNIDELKNGYLLAKYSFDGFKTIKFAYIDTHELKRLIKSNKIKGDINKGIFTDVMITDTSAKIKSIITEYDSLLFKDYMIFDKVSTIK